jgi:hypothetical protein
MTMFIPSGTSLAPYKMGEKNSPFVLPAYKHRMGSHCSSLQMSNILLFNGIKISEELCFGIGAGLGFIYRKAFSPPLYFILGRSDELEEKICYHLGGVAVPYKTDNNDKALKGVLDLLNKGQPVLVNIDASFFPYMRKKFNLFENVRYGGHRVTIAGYEPGASKDTSYFYLSDYAWTDLQKVSFAEMELARASDAGQTPPDNLFYTFIFPEKTFSIEEAIRSGIRLNIQTMLKPWFPVFGIPGLEKFCSRILTWKRTMKEELLKQNLNMTYMMMEVVGTGGGNFRRIYARFLRQASAILESKTLLEAFDSYRRLGDCWKEIAYLIKESAEDPEKGIWSNPGSTQKLLDEILFKEKLGIEQLKGFLNE